MGQPQPVRRLAGSGGAGARHDALPLLPAQGRLGDGQGGRQLRPHGRPLARLDARQLSSAQLWESLRENVEHPWSPPGGGPLGALSHDVIHGLDVSTALGRDDSASPVRVGMVLAGLRPKQVAFFGVDLDGVQLRADDLDWCHGSGRPVHGRAQDLLLLLCGRQLPAGRLRGPGSSRFTPVG